jgi:citrate/tricarballylate utilization protein
MQLENLLHEADRQLTICNACRLCEGFCAVFPALERRRTVDEGDILYLSNLCHDCQDCYTACMYAPPHEFAINVPAILSEVRLNVYETYASPRTLSSLLRHPRGGHLVALIGAILIVAIAALINAGPTVFSAVHHGPGAFYRVIPYAVMWTSFMAAALWVVGVWVVGAVRFWRDTASPLRGRVGLRAVGRALFEAATLRYMQGGGAGCDYPRPGGSYSRLILHSLVSYGFLAAFIATLLAALYQDVLGIMPPFSIVSAPVLFGAAGGVALCIGASGLLYLKVLADPVPSIRSMRSLDYAFLLLLDLVAITGIALLVLRDSPLMAALLVVHLGCVLGLFLTAPYGKFVHFVYRTMALVQNQIEAQTLGE